MVVESTSIDGASRKVTILPPASGPTWIGGTWVLWKSALTQRVIAPSAVAR